MQEVGHRVQKVGCRIWEMVQELRCRMQGYRTLDVGCR